MNIKTRETVLVAGAGIAGLGVALALGDGTRDITLIDRDPPPPEGSTEEAFEHWQRRGATQLRHSHVFLGRLTSLIRDRYPLLLAELLSEGARISGFEEGLAPRLRAKYKAQADDEDLAILFSRRTTLELVLRRYVASLPHVRFITDAGVRGFLSHRENDVLIADGLTVERDGVCEDMRANIVVDASGRNTNFPDWLHDAGVETAMEESPAGILYFTRHYRLRDGMNEPERDNAAAAGDLGYIKFAVFIADNRHFSITLATPEIETDLRKAIVRPEIFDAICAAIPGCASWVEPTRAEPVTDVYSMGNLKSVWRQYLKDGETQVLNFFAVGDAAVRTNPLYGRGCSAGVVHAHILREALDSTDDLRERARIVDRETFAAIRPYYDVMVKQDLQSIRRAVHERDPLYKPRFKARLAKSFAEDAIGPAARGDIKIARTLSRAFHMIDHPTDWLKNPVIMARILTYWATPKRMKQARGLYPPPLGPEREAMFAKLGLAN
jgi:2-polyprenyl-6-methoxyphenol hydroxylase-like FAD-dependent oxidoreductase